MSVEKWLNGLIMLSCVLLLFLLLVSMYFLCVELLDCVCVLMWLHIFLPLVCLHACVLLVSTWLLKIDCDCLNHLCQALVFGWHVPYWMWEVMFQKVQICYDTRVQVLLSVSMKFSYDAQTLLYACLLAWVFLWTRCFMFAGLRFVGGKSCFFLFHLYMLLATGTQFADIKQKCYHHPLQSTTLFKCHLVVIPVNYRCVFCIQLLSNSTPVTWTYFEVVMDNACARECTHNIFVAGQT